MSTMSSPEIRSRVAREFLRRVLRRRPIAGQVGVSDHLAQAVVDYSSDKLLELIGREGREIHPERIRLRLDGKQRLDGEGDVVLAAALLRNLDDGGWLVLELLNDPVETFLLGF